MRCHLVSSECLGQTRSVLIPFYRDFVSQVQQQLLALQGKRNSLDRPDDAKSVQ